MTDAPVDRVQDPHLTTIDLATPEHIKLHNKGIVGLPESDRYDLTKSKWTNFYQQLEDDVLKFGFKEAVMVVTYRYLNQAPTESNNFMYFHPSIK